MIYVYKVVTDLGVRYYAAETPRSLGAWGFSPWELAESFRYPEVYSAYGETQVLDPSEGLRLYDLDDSVVEAFAKEDPSSDLEFEFFSGSSGGAKGFPEALSAGEQAEFRNEFEARREEFLAIRLAIQAKCREYLGLPPA